MNEITFNGLKSYTDLGLIMSSYISQPPTPNTIKSSVPYMNGTVDFSNIYGEITYGERKINVSFEVVTANMPMAQARYSQVIKWLMTDAQAKLIYSITPGLYYLAKVESAPSWTIYIENGTLDVEFTAYPYQIGIDTEGSNIWDDLSFETDYIQDTKFDINGAKSIQLYNVSAHQIVPSIICSAITSIIMNGVTYNLSAGSTKDYRFILAEGYNNMTIKTVGNVEISFRKEVF